MSIGKEEIKNYLVQTLDEFIEMQAEHSRLFHAGSLSNIRVLADQREKLARRMKSFVDLAARFDFCREDQNFIKSILDRFDELMHTENDLRIVVSEQREAIRFQIGKLRKGKKALNGYSINGPAPLPRFLSSRS